MIRNRAYTRCNDAGKSLSEEVSPDEEHVFVFKTTAKNSLDLDRIGRYLDENDSIREWNVDLQDPDRVLRVVAVEHNPFRIIRQVHKAGFLCEPMPTDL